MFEKKPLEKIFPLDLQKYFLSFLCWNDLSNFAFMNKHWQNLVAAQKNSWKKCLADEKGLKFEAQNFPQGFLNSHPIDYRSLYMRLRSLSPNK